MRTIRHIAPYILLAAYMPLLVALSFHTHEESHSAASECAECAHHLHHRAHLSEAAAMAHDCVYCQLVSTSYYGSGQTAIVQNNELSARLQMPSECQYKGTELLLANPRAPPLQ